MRCLVVAGGDANDLPLSVEVLGPFDNIVCADGGVNNARRLALVPDLVVGDLDSLGADEQARLRAAGCRFIVHPATKDETDLELALLWCVKAQASSIVVIGASGNRPDHALANVLLLADRRLQGAQICLRSRDWEIWLPRKAIAIHGRKGDTVSLIPVSVRVRDVQTDGLEYRLQGETLRRGPARGVSNVMLADTASVRWSDGVMVVMHGPPQA